MLVFEAKLEGKSEQYESLDEAIRTARFIRNSCIRYWIDTKGVNRYDLSAYCAVLAKEFPWADEAQLNGKASFRRESLVINCSFLRQLQKGKTGFERISTFQKA